MSKEKDVKEHLDLHNFDVRIVERSIKRGLVTRKDYEKFMKTLPDSKDKVRPPDSRDS